MNQTTPEPAPQFLKVSAAAVALFGAATAANIARVIRWIDTGELAAIRVGERQDRLVPASEVERLHAAAEAARQRAAERHAAAKG